VKIAFVTSYDATGAGNWSGVAYFMAKALEGAGLEVHLVGPLEAPPAARRELRRATAKLSRRTYLPERDPALLRAYAAQTRMLLDQIDYDVVVSPGTLPIAWLEEDRPIVTWTDATFDQMIDYYPGFTNLTRASRRDGSLAEATALERVSLALYPSAWAAQSAVTDYNLDPAKVEVIPFGANLDHEPEPATVKAAIEARTGHTCELLFIGVEWERKGGDVALDLVRSLNRDGVPANLTIVGCEPAIAADLRSHVRVRGFLDKSLGPARAEIERLLATAHFLVLPARAECYGIVLCEANAYGVPCLTSNVGGIPEIIRPGINGQLFPLDAEGDTYADFVTQALSMPNAYQQLAFSSYSEYRTRLNWAATATRARSAMQRRFELTREREPFRELPLVRSDHGSPSA
jgi:glycosyltransferase involved in cell wall biosynthesis